MRLMHVMESTIGGTRRHLVDVARELARRGEDVHVVAAALRAPAFKEDLAALAEEGCAVTELPMVREVRPATDLRHGRELARIVADWRPDVVHTHSSKAGALGRRAARKVGGCAVVHTPHTFSFLFDAMFSAPKRALYRFVEERLARVTDRLVAVSESEAETIRASGVVDPAIVRVVPNGVDPEAWADPAPAAGGRAALGLPDEALVLAVVGLLNVAKGQDLAVRALGGVPGAHLLLVGDGEERAALDRLAREEGVADRAHLLGWRDDVPGLLALADAVVVPSRWEGMPYIALEAMAAGKPLVAARVDGVRDVVVEGETGWTCAVEDVGDLSRALGEAAAAGPEERARRGAAGRARVAAEYSIARMVDRLLDVYREVA